MCVCICVCLCSVTPEKESWKCNEQLCGVLLCMFAWVCVFVYVVHVKTVQSYQTFTTGSCDDHQLPSSAWFTASGKSSLHSLRLVVHLGRLQGQSADTTVINMAACIKMNNSSSASEILLPMPWCQMLQDSPTDCHRGSGSIMSSIGGYTLHSTYW